MILIKVIRKGKYNASPHLLVVLYLIIYLLPVPGSLFSGNVFFLFSFLFFFFILNEFQ